MKIKTTKRVYYGSDTITINNTPMLTLSDVFIGKGQIANVINKIDEGWIIELYGDKYLVPLDSGIEI